MDQATVMERLYEARQRIAELEAALRDVRAAIIDKAPDTLWAGLIETAVDRIDSVICEQPERT